MHQNAEFIGRRKSRFVGRRRDVLYLHRSWISRDISGRGDGMMVMRRSSDPVKFEYRQKYVLQPELPEIDGTF